MICILNDKDYEAFQMTKENMDHLSWWPEWILSGIEEGKLCIETKCSGISVLGKNTEKGIKYIPMDYYIMRNSKGKFSFCDPEMFELLFEEE